MLFFNDIRAFPYPSTLSYNQQQKTTSFYLYARALCGIIFYSDLFIHTNIADKVRQNCAHEEKRL
jgi:hypothetical protein